MRGLNPIRPPESGDGQLLQVQEIFPTLQGEGPRVGEAAVFIRLGGCNLACDFCDTEFESFSPLSIEEIIARVAQEKFRDMHPGLIVITGGEPLRQNIAPLCEALLAKAYTVQIETNGTLWRPLPEPVEVVCSPKNTGQGYGALRLDVLARARALKYVVSATHPLYDNVPEMDAPHPPIYVQPMDAYDAAQNAANLALAQTLAKNRGYIVSEQLHKKLGLP